MAAAFLMPETPNKASLLVPHPTTMGVSLDFDADDYVSLRKQLLEHKICPGRTLPERPPLLLQEAQGYVRLLKIIHVQNNEEMIYLWLQLLRNYIRSKCPVLAQCLFPEFCSETTMDVEIQVDWELEDVEDYIVQELLSDLEDEEEEEGVATSTAGEHETGEAITEKRGRSGSILLIERAPTGGKAIRIAEEEPVGAVETDIKQEEEEDSSEEEDRTPKRLLVEMAPMGGKRIRLVSDDKSEEIDNSEKGDVIAEGLSAALKEHQEELNNGNAIASSLGLERDPMGGKQLRLAAEEEKAEEKSEELRFALTGDASAGLSTQISVENNELVAAEEEKDNNEITYLGSAFDPSELDVIVGLVRGKVCSNHSGNLRLAQIVRSVLSTYSAPEATKQSKTELITSIVTRVRENNGGFVKFDSENGQWFQVGDHTAREKVSQAFRDALTDHYKSSSTSKALKRRQEIYGETSAGLSNHISVENESLVLELSPIGGKQIRLAEGLDNEGSGWAEFPGASESSNNEAASEEDMTFEMESDSGADDIVKTADPKTGRWSQNQELLFRFALKKYGKGKWKEISHFVPNRNPKQCKSHGQKILLRQEAGDDIFQILDMKSAKLNMLLTLTQVGPLETTKASRSKPKMVSPEQPPKPQAENKSSSSKLDLAPSTNQDSGMGFAPFWGERMVHQPPPQLPSANALVMPTTSHPNRSGFNHTSWPNINLPSGG